jgi:hypothetical protein
MDRFGRSANARARRLLSLPLPLLAVVFACGGRSVEDLLESSSSSAPNRDTSVARSGRESYSPPITCTVSADCMIANRDCCGKCLEATLESVIAITKRGVDAYREAVCTNSRCFACGTWSNPDLIAVCNNQKCQAIDITVDNRFTTCDADEDCVLRGGSGCCEPCGESHPQRVIALAANRLEDFRETVCRNDSTCPTCPTQLPSDIRAVCRESKSGKHCEVESR